MGRAPTSSHPGALFSHSIAADDLMGRCEVPCHTYFREEYISSPSKFGEASATELIRLRMGMGLQQAKQEKSFGSLSSRVVNCCIGNGQVAESSSK